MIHPDPTFSDPVFLENDEVVMILFADEVVMILFKNCENPEKTVDMSPSLTTNSKHLRRPSTQIPLEN